MCYRNKLLFAAIVVTWLGWAGPVYAVSLSPANGTATFNNGTGLWDYSYTVTFTTSGPVPGAEWGINAGSITGSPSNDGGWSGYFFSTQTNYNNTTSSHQLDALFSNGPAVVFENSSASSTNPVTFSFSSISAPQEGTWLADSGNTAPVSGIAQAPVPEPSAASMAALALLYIFGLRVVSALLKRSSVAKGGCHA